MSQGTYGNSDLDQIIKNLNSQQNKLEGLNQLAELISAGTSTATFLGHLEKLFSGIRTCLLVDPSLIDILLRVNQILLDMVHDIQHSDDLEIQYAQLVSILIENLGNPKAVVRKSTHKCIATYVKYSKKLEYVLLHIVKSGLDNSSTRTRQHSMLVIPALLSLKPAVLDKNCAEMIELFRKVIHKLKDPQEIVAKTARKLLLELLKCHPVQYETQLIAGLKIEEEKIIARSVLKNDEDEIITVLISIQAAQSKPKLTEDKPSSILSPVNQPPTQTNQVRGGLGMQSNIGKELSIIGKEILQSNNPNSQFGSKVVLEKIINEAKEESRYPRSQNGLYFGFLDESWIEALGENNQWKERTNAMEAIESKINTVLSSDKKVVFLPHATQFLGFMLQYIPDINFKISLTSVKIITKLLSMNIINFKKYYAQLVTSLIEKLSDSKVVIRQAVLKCCSLIIINYKASTFTFHAMRYLQHQNWHVREGILSLIAHCVISQTSNASRPSSQGNTQVPLTPDSDLALPLNPTLIQELCSLILNEDKQKIYQYIIDTLALLIDKSSESIKTQLLIQKNLGIPNPIKNIEEATQTPSQNKEQQIYKQVAERYIKGSLPFVNEEGIVDFPILTQTNVISQGKLGQVPQLGSFQSQKSEESKESQPIETLASNLKVQPSQNFLEMKKKQEEEKKKIQKIEETDVQKVAMWLPSFSKEGSSEEAPSFSKPNIKNARSNQNLQSKTKEHLSVGSTPLGHNKSDNKSKNTAATIGSFTDQPLSVNNSNIKMTPSINPPSHFQRSPKFSDASSNMFSEQKQKSVGPAAMTHQASLSTNVKLDYTPEVHQSKPRNIQSNELRQRTVDQLMQNNVNNDNFFRTKDSGNFSEVHIDMTGFKPSAGVRNMSSSTGDPKGFQIDQIPHVRDRLQLLRGNSKYQGSDYSQSPEKPDNIYADDHIDVHTFNTELTDIKSDIAGKGGFGAPIQRKFGSGVQVKGPIKAQHKNDFMQTITDEDPNPNITPVITKTKKPPLSTSKSAVKAQPRAQSVDNINNNGQSETGVQDQYSVQEVPLTNPDNQYKQSLEQFKSGDWSKQFDALNVIKRVALFHKHLLSYQNPLQSQIIKEVLLLVDSLRSQLAKNAMITIKTIIENISYRDIDPLIDSLVPPLLKKAADTNQFIAESADQALVALCSYLSENKVFNCLQIQQNVKSNPMKLKMAMCYNTLIEKLGPRIRQFSAADRLIQTIVSLLNEGAIEVRNMAKIGIMTLKNAIGSQQELEQLLSRCLMNEKQMEKIRQLLERSDNYESISNNASTRYGSSMRNASLDSRSAGPYRGHNPISAQNSDGFGKITASSGFNNMQATFMKNTSNSFGFGSTSNAFKNKSSNSNVLKPIDPMVMEEFKQICSEVGTNDWSKRLKSIDQLNDFVRKNISVIKGAAPGKFIQLIDSYCKLLTDNNAKVQSQAQQQFKNILANPDLKNLVEQHVTLVVQALNSNIQSTNIQTRDQADTLFNLLENSIDSQFVVPPLVAQINVANNRSKAQLVDRLSHMIERIEKVNLIQKYVSPLVMQTNKINNEAATNPKLKEALQRLQMNTQRVLQMSGVDQ